jgi:hypothetical protein
VRDAHKLGFESRILGRALGEASPLMRRAVERELGRLEHEWALLPLRVRGPDRVRLHADLTILAKSAYALSRERFAVLAA